VVGAEAVDPALERESRQLRIDPEQVSIGCEKLSGHHPRRARLRARPEIPDFLGRAERLPGDLLEAALLEGSHALEYSRSAQRSA